MISITIDRKVVQKEAIKIKKKLVDKYKISAQMSFKKLEYMFHGLETVMTQIAKQKLKNKSPDYEATLDLKNAKKIYFAKTLGRSWQKSYNRETFIGNIGFMLKLPSHRGFEYGYALADKNSKMRMNVPTMIEWIRDKVRRGTGNFYYKNPKTKKKEPVSEKNISKIAYLILRKRWGEDIKRSAPRWFMITKRDANLQKRINSLENLFIQRLVKDFKNMK